MQFPYCTQYSLQQPHVHRIRPVDMQANTDCPLLEVGYFLNHFLAERLREARKLKDTWMNLSNNLEQASAATRAKRSKHCRVKVVSTNRAQIGVHHLVVLVDKLQENDRENSINAEKSYDNIEFDKAICD